MKRRTLLRALPLLLAGAGGEAAAHRLFTITVLDLKVHGLSAVLRTPSGRTWLIDTGLTSKNNYYPARDVIAPLLKSIGVQTLDGVLVSHPHGDHYGGLSYLLEQCRIVQLVDAGYNEIGGAELETYRKLRAQYVAGGGKSVIVKQGDKLSLDPELDAEILWPPAGLHQPDPAKKDNALYNANSIVLRVRHGENILLFPGDDHGIANQASLIGPEKLKCDLLIAPHHGLNSTSVMAAATRPKIVVVSSLKEYSNPTIRPYELTSEAFKISGSAILATWLHGDITVSSDGRTLKSSTKQKP